MPRFFFSSFTILISSCSLGRLIMYFETNTFWASPLVAYFTRLSFFARAENDAYRRVIAFHQFIIFKIIKIHIHLPGIRV